MKTIYRIGLLTAFCCCIQIGASAQFNTDSLRRLVQSAADWRKGMDAKFQLALALHTMHTDSTLQYAQWFEKEAERRSYPKGMGMADELYAAYYMGQRAYDKSFAYYRKCIERYMSAGEQKRAAVALENMSFGLLLLRRYGEACDNLYKALDIYTARKDSADISTTCVNIGRVLASQNRFEESETFFRRAIAIDRSIGQSPRSAFSRIAGMFLQTGKLDSARHYYQYVLTLAEQSGDTRQVMRAKSALANLYAQTGDTERALAYFQETIAYFEQHNDRLILSSAYLEFANLENRLGHYKNALELTQNALNLVNDPKNYRVFAKAYENQARSYEGLGDMAQAFRAAKAWKAAADSLTAQENAAQVADITARYRTREQDAVIAEQKLALEREAGRRNLLLFGVALLSVAGIFLFFFLRNRERMKKQQLDLALQLQRAEAEKLRDLDKLKSDFFANISHELRTPLTLMQGPIDTVLKNPGLHQRDQSMLQLAQQNAKKLLGMIGDILDLTKMESGRLELDEEIVQFYPFLNRLIAQFESHAQRLGIQISFDYRGPGNLRLLLDRKKWETLFNNLLSNALKFTPPHSGGKILIRLEDRENQMLLRVEDNGHGIPPQDLERVFERFYRAPAGAANAVQAGGTGIGLALCREYATLFGGRIWAESPAGQTQNGLPGSAFYVEFPKKEVLGATEPPEAPESRPDTAASESLSPVKPHETTANILIVEDNEGLQQYLKAVFSPAYQTAVASNGVEALHTLEQNVFKPDLILSDLMMPGMDGLQLLEKLKKDPKFSGVPVVMLTARADMEDKLHALRLGVDDYLLKPFVEEELTTRVTNLLRNARARMEPEDALGEPEAAATSAHPAEIQAWLADLENAVEAQLGDFNLNAEALADTLAMSRAQFFRQVKKYTGLTPAQYLDEARFRRARLLLETARVRSVKAAAYEVGFRDEKHFAKTFKQRFGKYPSEYLG